MNATLSTTWSRFLGLRFFYAGVVVFFVLISVQYSAKIWDEESHNRSAFLRWRSQILELDQGVNIWERHNYPNPPIMVMLLMPLVALPPIVGSLIWFYLKVGMALAAIFMTFRLVETPGQPWPVWAKAVATLLSLRPIVGDLTHGNVNILILLLCVGALVGYQRRRGNIAGLCLALAIACKVTPAAFIPYFFWKRAWRLLAACAIGLVLFFWLVPGIFFGFGQNAEFLSAWKRVMIDPYAVRGEVTTEHENQSLPGLVHRMLTDSPAFSTFEGDRYIPGESFNIVAWPPWVARLLVKACMALFGVVILVVCTQPTWERQRWQLAAEYSLILLGMLLFCERTWKHHCVTLLVPFSVLVYYVATGNPGPKMKRLQIGILLVAALLMMSTGTGWTKEMTRMGKMAQVYGAYVWANLALAAGLAVVLYKHRIPAWALVGGDTAAPAVFYARTRALPDAARCNLEMRAAHELTV
jgi:alpha-1,2-mannosyltransferase